MSIAIEPITGSYSKRSTRAPRVAVLGATLGTGNLGVDALGAATVQSLVALHPDVEILYQSWVNKPVEVGFGGRSHLCQPLVIRRRPHLLRQNSVEQIRRLARLHKRLGPISAGVARLVPTWRQLRSCDVVLDISAGDSFADTYGEAIFWYQSQIKLMCLDAGIPLVLLPQTIGPFTHDASRRVASEILRRASLVCTRETAGEEEIRRLCGGADLCKVVESPDVAFLLEPSPTPLPPGAESHLESGDGPLIAINVSGLLYAEGKRFGLTMDFPSFMARLLRWALSLHGSRVLLVPHVVPTGGNDHGSPTQDTTDNSAGEKLLPLLDAHEAARVEMLRDANDPARTKYAMSRCDFFVGARMHAFIGAASQATPGALLAYSKKAGGTAAMAGFGDAVVDLRTLSADEAVAAIDRLYNDRLAQRERLTQSMGKLKARVRLLFSEALWPLIDSATASNPSRPPSAGDAARRDTASLNEDFDESPDAVSGP